MFFLYEKRARVRTPGKVLQANKSKCKHVHQLTRRFVVYNPLVFKTCLKTLFRVKIQQIAIYRSECIDRLKSAGISNLCATFSFPIVCPDNKDKFDFFAF